MLFTILGQALCGWLLADFLSGIFHWWEDRIPTERMPLLGKWLIEPNRLHHRDPMVFTKGSFLDRNQAMIVTALIVAGIWFFVLGPSVVWGFAALGGMFVNEVHRYAHEPKKAPKIIQLLQQTGALQSMQHHARHHKPPTDKHYCILTNWLNPFLDHFDIWHKIERVLIRLGFRISLGAR